MSDKTLNDVLKSISKKYGDGVVNILWLIIVKVVSFMLNYIYNLFYLWSRLWNN